MRSEQETARVGIRPAIVVGRAEKQPTQGATSTQQEPTPQAPTALQTIIDRLYKVRGCLQGHIAIAEAVRRSALGQWPMECAPLSAEKSQPDSKMEEIRDLFCEIDGLNAELMEHMIAIRQLA